MIKLYREDYNDDDYGFDYDTDMERYYYTVYYVTYYKDPNEYVSPIEEYEEVMLHELPTDESIDDDVLDILEKREHKLDDAVSKGEYEGLWLHKIEIPIESNFKRSDVDRYEGESKIIEKDITVDSTEIDIPDDWTEGDTDYVYLSDTALQNRDKMTESIMNMSITKHYRNSANQQYNEDLTQYHIGKEYPDFDMLEQFIVDYDVDLRDVEVGDILIRDWQYGHLANTGYIPVIVEDIPDDMRIVVRSADGKKHIITKDYTINRDAMYHRLSSDFVIDDYNGE